jgi:hypothetical protein
MRAAHHNGLSKDRIRELLYAGYSMQEIAAICGSSYDAVNSFIGDHRLSLTVGVGDPPPRPDLSKPGKIIVYPARVEGFSSTRRIRRISLAYNSLYARQLTEPEAATSAGKGCQRDA